MTRVTLIALPLALLAANAALHGAWSHRWRAWTDPGMQAAAARLDAIPLRVGEWDGARVEATAHELPEETLGRGVAVRYVSRTDGMTVSVYFACGPTDAAVAHVPSVCYPANGFAACPPDLRTTLPAAGGPGSEFWVSGFTRKQGEVPVHLRVLWAWSDGTGWQTPDNPGRAYRRTPLLHKCYFVRQIGTPDEPIDGDPCLRLMATLLPQLDEIVAGPVK